MCTACMTGLLASGDALITGGLVALGAGARVRKSVMARLGRGGGDAAATSAAPDAPDGTDAPAGTAAA
ncbi:MAG: hypothetical protein AB1416_09680 [Actinomycetota bacterium]